METNQIKVFKTNQRVASRVSFKSEGRKLTSNQTVKRLLRLGNVPQRKSVPDLCLIPKFMLKKSLIPTLKKRYCPSGHCQINQKATILTVQVVILLESQSLCC